MARQFHLENHPLFAGLLKSGKTLSEARRELSEQLWLKFATSGLILRPGFLFQARTDAELNAAGETGGYFRLSYSTAKVLDFCYGLNQSDISFSYNSSMMLLGKPLKSLQRLCWSSSSEEWFCRV